jgi:hypothetical protein
VQIEIYQHHDPRGQMGPHKLTLEYFFSKIRGPISIKIDANYPCIKGIQVCLDKGTDPHQMGDDNKNSNIGWPGHLKILFSRTKHPEKLKFTRKLPDRV